MNNRHQIKTIFLIHNLINGIKQKGFASRTTYILFNRIDKKKIVKYINQYYIKINNVVLICG